MGNSERTELMTPTIGRIVHVPIEALKATALTHENNGADFAPAMITRVWSPAMVNVRVLLDGREIPWLTSITLYDDRATYEASSNAYGCYWPERVSG